jgi:hypothetical protein
VSAAIAALGPGEELIDPATFATFFSNVGDVAAAARIAGRGHGPTPATLEAQIDASPSRAAVTSLAVRLAVRYCEAAAVFVVHRGIVRAIASEGCPGRHETALFLPSMPSVFSRVVASGEPYRGAPPDRVLERRVLRALGREDAAEIAILPARVGDRILMLLYADHGKELVSDGSFAALSVLGRRIGRAYERMILTRKQAA